MLLEDEEAGAREVLRPESELTCVHRNVSTCHYTYVTQFRPQQEEKCSETYTKTCSITFSRQPVVEVVSKCYRPLVTICGDQEDDDDDDEEEEVCRTVQESVCTTRYEAVLSRIIQTIHLLEYLGQNMNIVVFGSHIQ